MITDICVFELIYFRQGCEHFFFRIAFKTVKKFHFFVRNLEQIAFSYFDEKKVVVKLHEIKENQLKFFNIIFRNFKFLLL